LACGAKLTCYKLPTSSKVKVTRLEHNLEVRAATFPTTEIDTKETEFIFELDEEICKINEISRLMENIRVFDGILSKQKFRNFIWKISSAVPGDWNTLQKFLEHAKKGREIVDYICDADGYISMLFVSSHAMRRLLAQQSKLPYLLMHRNIGYLYVRLT